MRTRAKSRSEQGYRIGAVVPAKRGRLGRARASRAPVTRGRRHVEPPRDTGFRLSLPGQSPGRSSGMTAEKHLDVGGCLITPLQLRLPCPGTVLAVGTLFRVARLMA